MQSNLNPGQIARARPMSASLRTPRGNPSAPDRLRDGQAIPRLAPRPEEAPPGEDEPWLFAFPRCLTTADLWKMGFAQAIMFNAAGWTNEAAAAAEISSALRRAVPLPSLSAEHREDVEGAIAPSFIGGDVVIAVACHGLDNLSPDDREQCVACLAVRPHPHPCPHPRPHPHLHPHLHPVVARQSQARAQTAYRICRVRMAETGGLHQLRVESVRRAGARDPRRRGGGAGGLRPARGIGRLGRWGGADGLPRDAAGRVARALLCVSLSFAVLQLIETLNKPSAPG
jgi:hypothetical protein